MPGEQVDHIDGVFWDPGTILGPDRQDRWLVAAGQDDTGTLVAYATEADIDAAQAYVSRHGPRSAPEAQMTGRPW